MATNETGEQPVPADVAAVLAAAVESKRQFDEFVASSTTAINQLVDKARASAAEVDALKTTVAELKGGIEATQGTATTSLGAISQAKTEVETIRASASALSRNVKRRFEDAEAKVVILEAQQATLKKVLDDLAAIKAEAESEKEAVKAAVTEIETINASFDALKVQADERQVALTQSQTTLKASIDGIHSAHKQIVNFRDTLLVTTDDSESVEDEIEELRKKIETTLADITSKRDTAQADFESFKTAATAEKVSLFDALEAKILALLPSAGAAGLAYTYYDAKAKYSPTSFAGRPGGVTSTGWRGVARSLLSYNPSSLLATLIFYAMFFVPLVLLAWGSYELLQQIETDPDFVLTYEMLALRLLVALPLAAISAFGFASLHLYRTLYEEYNHKQRVMELYESFKKEIDENGGAEQKELLLDIMIKSVADKALGTPTQNKSSKPAKGDDDNKDFSRLEKLLEMANKVKAVAK